MFKIEKEKRLIRGCINNDRRAQKAVYEAYFNTMYSVCRRYIKNDDDILEVLNSGFLNVFKKISQFKGEGSFEGWIKRIIIHKSLDFIKLNKKYKEHIRLEENVADAADWRLDSMQYEEKEIEKLIEELPDVLQTVFNLFVVEGYSHKEISGMLNINESTSRWYLLKARDQLQLALKKNSDHNLSYHGNK